MASSDNTTILNNTSDYFKFYDDISNNLWNNSTTTIMATMTTTMASIIRTYHQNRTAATSTTTANIRNSLHGTAMAASSNISFNNNNNSNNNYKDIYNNNNNTNNNSNNNIINTNSYNNNNSSSNSINTNNNNNNNSTTRSYSGTSSSDVGINGNNVVKQGEIVFSSSSDDMTFLNDANSGGDVHINDDNEWADDNNHEIILNDDNRFDYTSTIIFNNHISDGGNIGSNGNYDGNSQMNKETFFLDNDNNSNNNNSVSDQQTTTNFKEHLSNGITIGGGGLENNGAGDNAGDGGSNFMLLFEDFGDFFYNFNGSSVTGGGSSNNINSNAISDSINGLISGSGSGSILGGDDEFGNFTYLDFNKTNCSTTNTTCFIEDHHNYWALILILFPFLTLFGNVLVIISVCRERSLQTVTNYFIVSLALADLLVAVVVMPFAVYVLVNGAWSLPNFVCDFYIAMDVICSTSSIFNLVAISIDRYIAVTQPIKYAKHKNSRRVCLTILLVWAISAAIGSPIVLGLNNTPNRVPDLCVFYNSDFIVYSSLSSFYIPCIIMVFLYWNIFKALRLRARKQRAARKPNISDLTTGGSVIENIAQTRRLAETTLDSHKSPGGNGGGNGGGCGGLGTGGLKILTDDQPTNTASGSNEEEDENAISPDIDDCHVIVNDKSTEFMLATVVEETGNVVAQISTQPQLIVADPNGNHDSGYAPSNVDDVLTGINSPPDSPVPSGSLKRSSLSKRDITLGGSPKREPLSVAMKPLSLVRYGMQGALALARNDSTISTISKTSSRKDKKNSQASRFTIYKVHKASKKKREKSSAKKERKATKTLAIVLGVFLVCWVPFFTCNIMDAMCTKLGKNCQPGVTAFILTTWLGYMNSFVNPVIYTIFNPEFRKAFKKIMHLG